VEATTKMLAYICRYGNQRYDVIEHWSRRKIRRVADALGWIIEHENKSSDPKGGRG
jgi:hypothetical protein